MKTIGEAIADGTLGEGEPGEGSCWWTYGGIGPSRLPCARPADHPGWCSATTTDFPTRKIADTHE